MPVVSHLLLFAWWDPQLARWTVWGGLVLIAIALALMMLRTRWSQHPLSKCVVLSLLAHVLLGVYMSTVSIVSSPIEGPPGDGGMQVELAGGPDASSPSGEPLADTAPAENWDAITATSAPAVAAPKLAPLDDPPPLAPKTEPERRPVGETIAPPLAALPAMPKSDAAPPQLIARNEPIVRPASSKAEAEALPSEVEGEMGALVPPPDLPSEPRTASSAGNPGNEASGSSGQLNGNRGTPEATLPKELEGRAGDHLARGRAGGATPRSEAAVAAALRWLASNQSANGRWDPRSLDAGTGLAADGEERFSAGAHADTGLTGLALLTFLASGHTHLQGEYRDQVRRGLEFLMASQDATGSLGATNNIFERMYCHAMATCAVSEAYAMTRDKRLLPTLRGAINYTVATQDRPSGSWRYQAGQPGDTSQLGWQVMALKSAELGGLPMPAATRAGMQRFLQSVALGSHRGLAAYQPTRPLATRSMTAEALACRRFLGIADTPESIREATDFILQEAPGAGTTNHYYWYYATLALYQIQGEAWQRWNAALQAKLFASQRQDGLWAGSWDPDPVWGRCGGRVYSTALCTLCLEVYYRYLPLYETARGEAEPRR